MFQCRNASILKFTAHFKMPVKTSGKWRAVRFDLVNRETGGLLSAHDIWVGQGPSGDRWDNLMHEKEMTL